MCFSRMQDSINLKRANDTLDALVAGEKIQQNKVEWSLQVRVRALLWGGLSLLRTHCTLQWHFLSTLG